MALIELSHLEHWVGNATNRVQVLKDISLSINKGDFVAIIGQSGSGKTTLMNILGCLDVPTSGSYRLEGQETTTLQADQRAFLRLEKLGFIFQQYNLLPSMSALENATLPAIYAGVPHQQRQSRGKDLLTELGLPDRLHHKPTELSGGQQQRVSIARALMNGGEIILADEPTGALDSKSSQNVMDILQKLHTQGHTIILVTHDAQIAARASRIIELRDGELISDSRKSPCPVSVPDKFRAQLHRTAWLGKDQFLESTKMSIQALLAHKLRSVLTMLGIIIGIASVVSVIALGKASQKQILSEIRRIGTDTISIYPGKNWGDLQFGKIKTLTVADADALSQQSYVQNVTPLMISGGLLTYRNSMLSAQLYGVGSHYFAVDGLEITSGRFFNAKDVAKSHQVVVIDEKVKQQLFAHKAEKDILGQNIFFQKRPLTIIGIARRKTSRDYDSKLKLWAPYTTFMHRITGNGQITSIIVQISHNVNSQAAEKSITHLMTSRHGSKDFFTTNSNSIQKTVESTTDTMTFMISSIALTALIVGGIGVMNIMLVSVTERTKEIGLRMAIGAHRLSILQQFLIEAALICLAGGLVGICLSFCVAMLFNMFVPQLGMSFSAYTLGSAILCSTSIGLIFGFIPARNAARLHPIDALVRE